MTREDVIRMAREVGAGEPSLHGRIDYVVMTYNELERFAALVAAKEREACAEAVAVFGEVITHVIRERGDA
jgi:hypothetical protein